MSNAGGKSRQFGFIGFRSEADALNAQRYFNGTFLDTNKLQVDIAKPVGDSDIPRPWSKYTKVAPAKEVETAPTQNDEKLALLNEKRKKHLASIGITEDDSKLTEFMQVMKPRSQLKTWQNDDLNATDSMLARGGKQPVIEVGTVKSVKVPQAASDDELYDDMPSKDVIIDKEEIEEATEENSFKPTAVIETPAVAEKQEIDAQQVADILSDSGRIFVRNLSFTCDEEDLRQLFGKFGPVSEVHIPLDRESKKSKGFAYVLFLIPEHAVQAFVDLDGTIFQGRLLHLIPSRDKRVILDESNKSEFQRKKAEKLKAQSANETSWNSLFMSADAVADSMANKLNVTKGDILDPQAENMAVRLALAETHIIEETTRYLEEEGVFIDAFKQNMKKERSDVVLMVKNIPFQTDVMELSEIFMRYGDIVRIVLPPTRTIALVEYSTPTEAKAAFSHLAFKNFKGKPLMLEKAPVDVFKAPPKSKKAQKELKEAVEESLQRDNDIETSTVFVKNLSFDTSDEAFTKVFSVLDGFKSAKISKKKNAKTNNIMSMGFGFVEFTDKSAAKNAIKTLQNYNLDGHALQLKFSDRSTSKKAADSGKEIKAIGTKLLIRNVPFEASKKDITELFGTYGQLKRVRMPKKMDNKSHRGFAFVDFLTKQEAKNAFESLASTHLYGRHLVIEWAEEDDSIETIREKTRKIYETVIEDVAGFENTRKKQRISLDEDGGDLA